MQPVARYAASLLLCASAVAFAGTAVRANGSLADTDAAARAAGNRPALARGIGDALFATSWPVQITKVRVDAVGAHAVAGLTLSGVKFHAPVDRSAFLDEIAKLVALTFANSTVEEVDVWTTVPLPTHAHEVVSGDLAMPTSHIVFAVTAKRDDGDFAGRLAAGRDVFWDDGWARSLGSR